MSAVSLAAENFEQTTAGNDAVLVEGALPAASPDQVIAAVKALDVDDARGRLASQAG